LIFDEVYRQKYVGSFLWPTVFRPIATIIARSYDAWMLLADMLCWRRRGYHFQHKMSNIW